MIEQLMKKDFPKKDGTILISNELNHFQTKTFNALYAYVLHKDDFNNENYKLKVQDLMYLIGREHCKSTNQLDDILKSLVNTQIMWNEFGTKAWGRYAMLSGFEIKRGTIYYSFDSLLKKRLMSQGETYTSLRLTMQKSIKNKHAYHAYEICKKYLDLKRGCGETPWYSLDEFKKLFGLDETKYKDFKILNRDVIKKIDKDINGKTDIAMEFTFQREADRGRRVVGIKMKARLTDTIKEMMEQRELPELDLNEDIPEHKLRLLVTLKHDFQVSDKVARELIEEYSLAHINANLKRVQKEHAKKPRTTLGGFTKEAIVNNYANYSPKSSQKLSPEQELLTRRLMKEFGVSRLPQAQILVETHHLGYLDATLKYITQEHEKSPKKDLGAYTYNAIKDNYVKYQGKMKKAS